MPLDTKKLVSLTKDPKFKLFMKYLAERERPRLTSDLNVAVQALKPKLTIDDLRAICTQLEELGAGKVEDAVAAKNRRFRWKFNLIDIGRAALGEKILPRALSPIEGTLLTAPRRLARQEPPAAAVAVTHSKSDKSGKIIIRRPGGTELEVTEESLSRVLALLEKGNVGS